MICPLFSNSIISPRKQKHSVRFEVEHIPILQRGYSYALTTLIIFLLRTGCEKLTLGNENTMQIV